MIDYQDYKSRADYLDEIASSSNSITWQVRKDFSEAGDFGSCIVREYSSGSLNAVAMLWSSGAVSIEAMDVETGVMSVETILAFGDEIDNFVEFVAPLVRFLRGAENL